MIKALSLAAALALLPLSSAFAQERDQTQPGAAEAALEAAAEVFEARMEEFAERAEVIGDDESLTEQQRETAIAALWAEYQPAVTAFTTFATQQAGAIAAEAMAGIDMEALVAEAMSNVDMSGAMAMAQNGAWASNDPEHMATYGLMADYALGEVADGLEEAEAEMIQAQAEMAAELAAAAADAEQEADDED